MAGTSALTASTPRLVSEQDFTSSEAAPSAALANRSSIVPKAQASSAPIIALITPLDGLTDVIQPGGWVTIYGSQLANVVGIWNGDFPTSLNGTTVEINGKAAYLSFVSPIQINLQAPDDTALGVVSVVVKTAAGSATANTTLGQFSPNFELRDSMHVAAIILRSDGSGAYGNGSYDILGPGGDCLGYMTVGAKPGDVVEMFATGFGPTTPAVPAGHLFSGAAPVNSPFSLLINNVTITPNFVGLSST